MRIMKNTTNLDSKKLQSLFSFIHNLIATHEGRLKHWKDLKIQINNRSFGFSGRAYIGQVYGEGWDILLKYSKQSANDIEDISQLFAHELMHSYGYRDKKAKGKGRGRQFPVDPLSEKDIAAIKKKFDGVNFNREAKPKVKIDHVALRKQRAEKNLANWESKLKFAQNKVKKYHATVSYYKKKTH
jgi:hypothetical protein